MNDIANTPSFRDKVATVDEEGRRVWVFPQQPVGRLYNMRTWVSLLYLVVFFGLPFIKWNGHPLFLFNVIERRFILFGQIFWPQDFFIFGVGMIVFILFIGLFTIVFGRFFCGWICPQTIFMEMIFRRIEYWIEGDAAAQRMLSKEAWNSNKIIKKAGKWLAFWLLSFLIANTFLAYITGAIAVKKIVTEPLQQHLGGFIAIFIFTSVFFAVYSWFREQVCTVVCPYGRLQGVLLNKQSIVVAYDYHRGEPREKYNKKQERTTGDCIDCAQCVKVCPTGIDIRNGTQLECTNCTACIDACNKMMKAINLPEGLIRYASEESVAEKKPVVVNRRMKALMAAMVLLLFAEGTLLATRSDIGVSILRTAGQLYQLQPDHKISNLYNYKLLNKTYGDKTLYLKPENFKGSIQLVGEDSLVITKENDLSGSMFIYLDSADVYDRKTVLQIGVYEEGRKVKEITTSFLGPF